MARTSRPARVVPHRNAANRYNPAFTVALLNRQSARARRSLGDETIERRKMGDGKRGQSRDQRPRDSKRRYNGFHRGYVILTALFNRPFSAKAQIKRLPCRNYTSRTNQRETSETNRTNRADGWKGEIGEREKEKETEKEGVETKGKRGDRNRFAIASTAELGHRELFRRSRPSRDSNYSPARH